MSFTIRSMRGQRGRPQGPSPQRGYSIAQFNPRADPYAQERADIRAARPEGARFDPLSRDLLDFYSVAPPDPSQSFGRNRRRQFGPNPVYYREPSIYGGGSTQLGPESRYYTPGVVGGESAQRLNTRYRLGAPRSRSEMEIRRDAYNRHLLAEERAGRRLNPGNQALIKYYASRDAGRASDRRSQTPSPTPFLGREPSSPTFLGGRDTPRFLGRQGSPSFLGSSGPTFTGRANITDYRLFGPQGVFLGRGNTAPAPAPAQSGGVAEGVAGMMGGGLVEPKTPFRKGGAMDRMVSEMTRNISRR